MPKTYVLDTNVLLHCPQAIMAFGDNTVVIPEVVFEELDRFKKESGELGINARYVGRIIDNLRQKGRLNEGVFLDNGGILKVEMNHYNVNLPPNWDKAKADNRIIQVCKGLENRGEQVILVTKDIFERIKADILDVFAQDFLSDHVPKVEEQYKGRCHLFTSGETINSFFSSHRPITLNDLHIYQDDNYTPQIPNLTQNEFIILHSVENSKHTALGRFNGNSVVPLIHSKITPFGVIPRNAGQKFMQEALCTDADIAPLVIVKGPAGTAKTFYALAVGLHKMLETQNRVYRKMLICRPNITMDEKIGFLPGSEQEKIAPLMRPIRDNLETLLDCDQDNINEKQLEDKVDEFFDRKIITMEALAFLRGRSLQRHWVIIDEAQNLTPKQVKGIITRAGLGTKIILLGDPEQIDHPFLDARSNGLVYAAEKMKGSPYCFQVTMLPDECERSPLAAEGARRM